MSGAYVAELLRPCGCQVGCSDCDAGHVRVSSRTFETLDAASAYVDCNVLGGFTEAQLPGDALDDATRWIRNLPATGGAFYVGNHTVIVVKPCDSPSDPTQPDAAERARGDLSADDRVVLALSLGVSRVRDIAAVARSGTATVYRVLAGPLCLRVSGRGDFDLTPVGRRRVGELTRALRDFEPSLSQDEACRVLLSIEREPAPEPPPVVWTATFRCGRCDLTGLAADDGDTRAPKCPQCGARELTFGPAPEPSR